jgi:transposase
MSNKVFAVMAGFSIIILKFQSFFNFPDSKSAVGYVGFYPKIYESGQSRRDNKISKRGPKVLRWALYMATVASLKHNKEMRTLYHKKLSQGKTEKQALICVGKKLLQWTVENRLPLIPYNRFSLPNPYPTITCFSP